MDTTPPFALGNTLLAQGRFEEAVAAFREAVQLAPSYAGARTNLGIALVRLQQLDEAHDCFRAAAVLQPFAVSGQTNLARALQDIGRHDEATECFRRACLLDPGKPSAHLDLAQSLHAQDRLEEAIAAYRAWLSLAPAGAPEQMAVHNNLGNALRRQGQLDEALAYYRAALRLEPKSTEILANLGNALMQHRSLAEAERCFRTALRIDSDNTEAHAGLALVLLTQGALAEGFKEYEWRWQMPQMRPTARAFGQPQWRGEQAPGRTLLIHAEQGFGDTLQFCRYATLAAAQGLRVVLEVQPQLLRLLRRLPGIAMVVARGDPLPPFDLHCPTLSLPLAFGTTPETIPSDPYLDADPAAVTVWAKRLEALSGLGPGASLRIGVVWAGNPYRGAPAQEAVDRRRSISPALLRPLFEVPGTRFVSLQMESVVTPDDPRLIELMDEVSDFADTAALVANLDLVISVDTAVVHLAASLGRPVWLLDRFDACWRWHNGRRDSAWYPSLRIYRQQQPGNWTDVLSEVKRDLDSLLRASGSG